MVLQRIGYAIAGDIVCNKCNNSIESYWLTYDAQFGRFYHSLCANELSAFYKDAKPSERPDDFDRLRLKDIGKLTARMQILVGRAGRNLSGSRNRSSSNEIKRPGLEGKVSD